MSLIAVKNTEKIDELKIDDLFICPKCNKVSWKFENGHCSSCGVNLDNQENNLRPVDDNKLDYPDNSFVVLNDLKPDSVINCHFCKVPLRLKRGGVCRQCGRKNLILKRKIKRIFKKIDIVKRVKKIKKA